MTQTVKQFVVDAYKLVSASTPTVPLHGSDNSDGLRYLNDLLKSFSGTGLMLTIAKEVEYTLEIGQQNVIFGEAGATPTPDVTTYGRLANCNDAWLILQGVTYPLIPVQRSVFDASYKYDPQSGLPRFIIIYNDDATTRMRIYPSASQEYELHVYGKFELSSLGENGNMSVLPNYYQRYLKFALAKDIAMYKGRSEAWTEKLEDMLKAAKMDMESVSTVNLTIDVASESLLNGRWRVQAGV